MRRRFLAWEQDTGNAFEYLHGTLLAYMLGRWVKRLANPKTNLLHFGEVLVETRDLMGRVMPRLPVPWSSPQVRVRGWGRGRGRVRVRVRVR